MSDALRRLGEVSRQYERAAVEYGPIAEAAARAEAEYRRTRARFVVTRRSEDPKASVAYLDSLADADETVSALLEDRLVKQATAEAARERLRQLREQVANGRTAVASEREADRIHATGTGGAA